MTIDPDNKPHIIDLTAEIVSAYVSNNPVPASDLAQLIQDVAKAVNALSEGQIPEKAVDLVPAVPVKKSVMPDYIISLEDGQKFKSLKRALKSRYGLTPEEYRAKWGLPADYPMVAPNYAKKRSELAKAMGLGRKAAATSSRRKKAA